MIMYHSRSRPPASWPSSPSNTIYLVRGKGTRAMIMLKRNWFGTKYVARTLNQNRRWQNKEKSKLADTLEWISDTSWGHKGPWKRIMSWCTLEVDGENGILKWRKQLLTIGFSFPRVTCDAIHDKSLQIHDLGERAQPCLLSAAPHPIVPALAGNTWWEKRKATTADMGQLQEI